MTIESFFSPDGILGNKLQHYSYREDQEKMAALVEKAFEECVPCVVEAGTGIGKSFAYLFPAFLLLSKDSDSRVVVATSTIPLQKQLYDKDIPFLIDALGMSPSVAILFGRANYLCLRKYRIAEAETSLISTDMDSAEGRLKNWVATTETGSRIDMKDRSVAYLTREMMSDEDDCLGRSCPHYQECFFYKARRNAQKARLIVTNHHIVLSDAQIRWENKEDFTEAAILPAYTHLIIDEAHHIESEATEAFSDKYSLSALAYNVDSLKRKMSRYGNLSLIEFLSPYEKEDRRGEGRKIIRELDALLGEAEEYNQIIKTTLTMFSDRRGMLLSPLYYDRYRSILRNGEQLAISLSSLGNRVMDLWEWEGEDIKQYIDRAARYGSALCYLSDVLRAFIRFNDWDSLIPYATDGGDGNPVISLAPMAVGPIINSRIIKLLSSVLYCSATLSVAGSFDFFAARAGLKEEKRVLEGIFMSPFNYQKQLMYLIPQDGKEWVNRDSSYIDYAVSIISRSIESSAGGALVLFTSIAMMKEVYERVKAEIGERNELLIQDGRTERHVLLSTFKRNEDSSLFATSSFWEGIDAPGNTLRLVIIVKLPFEVPSDPITLARSQYINAHEERGSFMTLTLPNAVIRMKQGVGRLIRNEDDKGIVMVLDGRIVRKGYRHTLLSSLPQGYFPDDTSCDNIPDKIERFLF